MKNVSLGSRIGHGLAADTAFGLLLRLASLGVTIAVARNLTQSEFGAVTIALAVFGISETLTNLSLETALVRRPELPGEVVDVAWTMAVMRAVVIVTAVYFAAPTLAKLWDPNADNSVTLYLRVLAVGSLLSSLANNHTVKFRRELRFSLALTIANGRTLLGTLASLLILVFSSDPLALVVGPAVGNGIYSALTWLMVRPRPRPRWSREIARELFGFGRWLLAHSIFVYLIFTVDSLYIGKVLGLAMVGAYSLAWRVINTLMMFLTRSLSTMLVSAYASMQTNQEQMNQTVLRALCFASCAGALSGAVIVMFSPELFHLMSTSGAWREAVPVAQVLTLLGFTRVTNNVIVPMFSALGDPRSMAMISGIQLLSLAPALYFGARFGGTTGVAIGVSLSAMLGGLLVSLFASRKFSLRLGSQLLAMLPPVVVCTPAAVLAWSSVSWISIAWLRLGLGSALLVATFIGLWEGFRRIAPVAWGPYPALAMPVAGLLQSRVRRLRARLGGRLA